MKRQICSYDMVSVPSSSYTITDAEGDIYPVQHAMSLRLGCNARGKHNLPELQVANSCRLQLAFRYRSGALISFYF